DVSINLCGGVTIRKQTVPDGLDTKFNFTTDLKTDSEHVTGFQLRDDEIVKYPNVLFGTYHVEEQDLGPGTQLEKIDCHASSDDVEYWVDLQARKVTFTIDDEADMLDCTFVNKRPLT